ncbi:MAG: hypothetical protein LBT00_10100 [Spirochaetaceae bacterium]|jgi:hypothetical protein|nr:hypothetical protein [Spirochaetaceae bacterium]
MIRIRKLLVLLVSLAVVGCGNETADGPNNGNDPPQKIDSRLVGEKWYDGAATTHMTFFRFSETAFTSASWGEGSAVTVSAYTKNGKVLQTGTDTELLSYVFVDPSEYEERWLVAWDAGNEVEAFKWHRRKQAAGSGNMARFTIIAPSIDTTYIDGTTEWARWGSVPPAQ